MQRADEPLADLASAVLDGTFVNWECSESTVDELQQPLVRQLKVVAKIVEFHRGKFGAAAARSADAAPPIKSPEVLEQWGHLKILEFVGRGSFGEVYRAWNTRLDREVALKLLHPSRAEQDWVLSERHLLRVPAKPVSSAAQYRPIQTIFGEDASTLALSDTNHRLVYTRESWNSNLYKVGLSGKSATRPQKLILSSGMNYLPDFSSDGRRIAFVSTRSGSEEIWVCDSDGRSNMHQLTEMGGYMTSFPRWSPDGSRILFHSMRAGSQDLYVIGKMGGNAQRITKQPGREVEASWSRDGNWIYFESNRSGSSQVYRIPASGGDAVQLTREGGFTPIESYDGRWVFYKKGAGLWKVSIESGIETPVIDQIGDQLNYAVAESGVYFMDVSRKGNVDIRVFDFAAGKVYGLLETDKARVPLPLGIAISPDRRSIVFSQWDRFDSDLILVENFK